MRSILRSPVLARTGGTLLILGPLVAWAAEIVTAAAWQHPHYSFLYNWVSHLGLPERETAFGQVADSPLAWVMNSGWIFYGVVHVTGALLAFDPRRGWRPVVLTALSVLAGVGVSLVGIFHGSTQNVANGTIVFHALGAQTVIIAGNVFTVVTGLVLRRRGSRQTGGLRFVLLGVTGLIGMTLFMIDAHSATVWNIGLFERWAIYPAMVGHLLAGLRIRSSVRGDLPAGAPGEHSVAPVMT